jgi:hypothetical protein
LMIIFFDMTSQSTHAYAGPARAPSCFIKFCRDLKVPYYDYPIRGVARKIISFGRSIIVHNAFAG